MESKYRLISIIGVGAFGEVWKAISLLTGKEVALKLDVASCIPGSLKYEAKVLTSLMKTKHTPTIYGFGKSTSGRSYIAMTLLGDTLEERLSCGVEVLTLASDMLDAIRCLHRAGFVHRDIKPGNFRYGRDDPDTIYLIDYGLSKQCGRKGATSYGVVGTRSFMSLGARMGQTQWKHDDVESWFYAVVYLWSGELPWAAVSSPLRTGPRDEFLDVCGGSGGEIIASLRAAAGPRLPDYDEYMDKVRTMLVS